MRGIGPGSLVLYEVNERREELPGVTHTCLDSLQPALWRGKPARRHVVLDSQVALILTTPSLDKLRSCMCPSGDANPAGGGRAALERRPRLSCWLGGAIRRQHA
eukprot:jgi/Mesen1/8913/ME000548S08428